MLIGIIISYSSQLNLRCLASNSHFAIVGRNKPACEGSEVIEKIGGGRFRHSVTRENRSLPQPYAYHRHQRPK